MVNIPINNDFNFFTAKIGAEGFAIFKQDIFLV